MSRYCFAGIWVLLLALGVLIACDINDAQPPSDADKSAGAKAVAEKYLDAVVAQDFEEAYKYVSQEVKTKYPIENVIAMNDKLMANGEGWTFKLISKLSVAKIGEISIQGDTATVAYSLFTPDIKPVIEDREFLEVIRAKAKNGEDVSKMVEKRLNSVTTNTERIERTLTMIRVNGVWKVNSFS